MKVYNIAVIGCGMISKSHFAAIEMLPNAKAELVNYMLVFKDEQGNKGLLCGVRPPQGKERKRTEI